MLESLSSALVRESVVALPDAEDVVLGLTVRLAGAGSEVRSVTTATEGMKAIHLFEPGVLIGMSVKI